MSDTFVLLEVEDWAVLYKNGEAVYQGHSVPTGELTRYFGVVHEYHEGDKVDDHVMEMGRFPHFLVDLDEERGK